MTFGTRKRAAARNAARASVSLVALLAVAALVSAAVPVAPAAAQQPARPAAPANAAGGGPPADPAGGANVPATSGPAAPAGGTPSPASADVSQRPSVGGYLGAHLPDYTLFLPPPPVAGSPLAAADAAIFRETRKLVNGPRWQLAANDDKIGHKALLGDFGCATGLDLAAVDAPALSRVLTRSRADIFALVRVAKDAYKRPRPYVELEGPLCVVPTDALTASGSYPSGHAATAWVYALLLAEIDSEHADAILLRGRAFGESRVVCGVHYASDIEAGRLTATALVAELHGAPQFETDIASARAELFSLRGRGQTAPAACEKEDTSLATPW
jgi:acid phosphatase (class A)